MLNEFDEPVDVGRENRALGRSRRNTKEIANLELAERVGFEPTVEFPLHTLSKRAPSTTRTSLRYLLRGLCPRTPYSLSRAIRLQ